MILRNTLAGLLAATLAIPAWADSEIEIHDAYARAALPSGPTGAAFMIVHNHGDTDDRLIGVSTDAAERAELHTHAEGADGMMQMRRVEGGFDLPAGGEVVLERGGHHVMLMGLTTPFEQGATITVTLEFEAAGPVEIDVPVDNTRAPGGHGEMEHGSE